ncbi:MAG: hypothetical protein HYY00_00820 [Chloroflexi bacterium]|nr:hypothetical protein [Chloroflexota bacterium]
MHRVTGFVHDINGHTYTHGAIYIFFSAANYSSTGFRGRSHGPVKRT